MNNTTLTEAQVNTLRGKSMANATTKDEIMSLFHYIDYLEELLDETDESDFFGTKGWRHLK